MPNFNQNLLQTINSIVNQDIGAPCSSNLTQPEIKPTIQEIPQLLLKVIDVVEESVVGEQSPTIKYAARSLLTSVIYHLESYLKTIEEKCSNQ